MTKHMLLASAALFSLAVATPALADDLNPQPEPPGVHKMQTSTGNQMNAMGHTSIQDNSHTTCTATIGSATGGAGAGKSCASGQHKPLVRKAGGTMTNTMTNAGETHGFNPQPDPPVAKMGNTITNAGETHGFNPQPDPPGDAPTQTQAQH